MVEQDANIKGSAPLRVVDDLLSVSSSSVYIPAMKSKMTPLEPAPASAEPTTQRQPKPFLPETDPVSLQSVEKDMAAEPRYNLVTFTPGDSENPKNWSKAYKWYCTMVVALTCFVVAFASSVITADIAGVVREFDVSEELALASISLFVVGFGVGPMVFAPLSEVYGRRII